MRVRHQVAHDLERFAGVDQIVDHQNACAVAADVHVRRFDYDRLGLGLMVVAFHADRIDRADVQFARDDHRGGQPAAGDRDHSLPPAVVRPLAVEPPGKRAAVAVDLVPADVEAFFMGQAVVDHVSLPSSR